MDLKELESGVDPRIHWYYQAKKVPLIDFVKAVYSKKKTPLTIIDLGSGSGFFMQQLLNNVPAMVRKVYLVDTGYSEGEVAVTQNQMLEKTRSLPEKIENAIVVMMDVLEHLESDHGMLREIKARSSEENYFFITVPAFMNLWSGHDVFLGHYRRYTILTLRKLLQESGYAVQHIYYYYGLLYPVVWLTRKLKSKASSPQSDMRPVSPFSNRILNYVCSFELPFRKMNRIAGVTCVAEGTFKTGVALK